LAIALWAFGLSTTTLLVGVWGRSVAADQTAMSASLEAALDPEAVSDQVTDWIVTEAIDLPNTPAAAVEEAVQQAAGSAEARAALRSLIEDIVIAASAPPGSSTVIDVRSALESIRPGLVSSLSSADVPVSEAEVDELLSQIEGLVLTSSNSMAAARPVAQARSALTVVLLVGAGALLLFGSLAVLLSGGPLAMLRTLANRLAVSALTFVLFLRIGAWAVDPGGGRSPLRSGGALLLGSNQGVIWALASAGLLVSLVVSRRLRSGRSVAPIPPSSERPPPAELVSAGNRDT
jgi:hypothetical protein